jgi:mRNA interferase MazF
VTPQEWSPRRGDVVWLTFDPVEGHEQGGRRPAVILSQERYARLTGLALCCPVTSRVKGYVMEFVLPPGEPVHGAVLTDQLRTVAWRERDASLIGLLTPSSRDRVLQMARLLLA